MSCFYLVEGDELACPHCGKKFDVKWDTEYGDPLFGEHSVRCKACDKSFDFGVYIQYTQPQAREKSQT